MNAEGLTAIAEVLDAIAWPAVALIFLISQRRAIRQLIEDIESINLFGGGEAKFRRNYEREARLAASQITDVKLPPSENQIEAAERIGQAALDVDDNIIRHQAMSLAREYERVRASMPPGSVRTRRMEVVFTKMRVLGLAFASLLEELMASSSPGERLAAIAALQLQPRPEALEWLVERLSTEKPFVGYHAAVALLVAVRTLDRAHDQAVRQAIESAAGAVERLPADADRTATIRMAEKELENRLTSEAKGP